MENFFQFYIIISYKFYHCHIVIDFMKSMKSMGPINIDLYFLSRFIKLFVFLFISLV